MNERQLGKFSAKLKELTGLKDWQVEEMAKSMQIIDGTLNVKTEFHSVGKDDFLEAIEYAGLAGQIKNIKVTSKDGNIYMIDLKEKKLKKELEEEQRTRQNIIMQTLRKGEEIAEKEENNDFEMEI